MSTIPTVEPIKVSHSRLFYTVERYDKMHELGVFTEQDKVELIEGVIYEKMPVNPPHEAINAILMRLLAFLLPSDYFMRVQMSVQSGDSVPEPDISITRGVPHDYFSKRPSPQNTPFVIEVADSSLQYDQTVKLHLYALSGFETYWIVNIPEQQVEVYTVPVADKYTSRLIYLQGQTVPVQIDGRTFGEIAVVDLFPSDD